MGQLSLHEKQELAEEAKRLLMPGSLFNKILNGMVVEYHENLIQADINSLTAAAAHASMKALNDIKGRLKSIENDAIMAQHRAEKDGQ